MVVEETTNGIILVYGLFYCYIDLMALLCSYLYHFLFSAKYIYNQKKYKIKRKNIYTV
jgi:hypothetical protein